MGRSTLGDGTSHSQISRTSIRLCSMHSPSGCYRPIQEVLGMGRSTKLEKELKGKAIANRDTQATMPSIEVEDQARMSSIDQAMTFMSIQSAIDRVPIHHGLASTMWM